MNINGLCSYLGTNVSSYCLLIECRRTAPHRNLFFSIFLHFASHPRCSSGDCSSAVAKQASQDKNNPTCCLKLLLLIV